jgi:3-methylcrotonyl-CoA carboxylase alpha subunit
MDPLTTISRIADRTYRVEHEGRNEIVYVAGPAGDQWIFWNGQVFHGDFRAADSVRTARPRAPLAQSLMAPMPARISRVLAKPGAAVKKGDTLIVLEAMKMELPVRAPADAVVAAVRCREGELVEADQVLIDLK